MTKMRDKFYTACRKLLNLMERGKLNLSHEGSRTDFENGEKKVNYKNGYHLELTNLIYELYDDDNSDVLKNYSHEYIEEIINDFLFRCYFDDEKDKRKLIDYFFSELKDDLKKTNEYLIPISIDNLLFNSSVTIGRVEFIPYSNFDLSTIFKEAGWTEEIIEDTSYFDREEVKSVGLVSVRAGDITKAMEKAENLVDQSLNVIRLLSLSSNFGIQGKYNHPLRYNIKIFNITQEMIDDYAGLSGSVFKTEIDKKIYEEMGIYTHNIDKMLKKSENQRSELEKKLLIAINLFGEIQKNGNQPDNIIRIFSSFETLLVGRNEQIKFNLPERISFISESDKTGRLNVYKLVNDMYTKRNELVHEGETVVKEIDYDRIVHVLCKCILIIAKNIDEYPNLNNWITLIDDAREARFNEKLSFQS